MKLCKCGCGEKIIETNRHKYVGIPSFKRGHGSEGRICSIETRKKISLANKGKIVSVETRKKLSDSGKGNKNGLGYRHTKSAKNKISDAGKGRILSIETRRKMSLSKMGTKSYTWQGGKSFEPYTPKFNNNLKEKIRNRDNCLCQLCNKTEKENGRKLAIHHIDYSKENCNKKNLIALCHACNSRVNANRIFWTGFFTCYLVFKLFKLREV